ncbi:MAG: permease-like cell division protein FtsX [Candidatus Wallbacteria bacterium]|nr:permease-like cell division protein FtsX [Candidatus Wallbacteria bacterium]
MKDYNRFSHALKETWRNMRYFSLLSFTSLSTVTIVLTILGIFLAFSENLKHLSRRLDQEITISAFLVDVPDEIRIDIITKLKSWDNVEKVTFIPSDQAMQSLEKELSLDMGKLISELGENPIPDVLEIKPADPSSIPELASRIKKEFPWVVDISYGKELVGKVVNLSRAFRLFAAILVVLLGSASLFIIANTIRITLYARKEEIEVMSLIGASRSFIGAPYILEGIFQGLAGAVISLSVCLSGYHLLAKHVNEFLPFLPILPAEAVFPSICLKVTGLGTLIGLFGSWFTLLKHFEK